jgi:cell division protein FtsQ
MPMEMDDEESEESAHRGSVRRGVKRLDEPGFGGGGFSGHGYEEPRGRWWQAKSSVGRFFLGMVALIVLGGVGSSAYLLKNYLSHDSRFQIGSTSNIEASGLSEVSRAEILPVFGEDVGRNIFFVPLADRRKQLEQIPWVERATVMRILPDQIRVSVVERQPVAFARRGEQFGLVDANGVLLTMPAAMMAQRHYSFPVVTGIDPGDRPEARKARMAVYQRLLTELDSGGQKLSAQISEIDLTDPEDARVTMQDDTTLLHFGQERFLERYKRYKAHISELRQQYPKLVAVDLRYEQQAVMEMATGESVAQAAPEGEKTDDADSLPASKVAKSTKNPDVAALPAKNAAAHTPPSRIGNDKKPDKTAGTGEQRKTAESKPLSAKDKLAKSKAAREKVAREITAKERVAKARVVREKAAKERVAQEKATQEKKKQAAAERVALKTKRQRIAPNLHPTAISVEGQ